MSILSKSIAKIGNIEICEQYYYFGDGKNTLRYAVYHNECRLTHHKNKNRIPHFYYPECKLSNFILSLTKTHSFDYSFHPKTCCVEYWSHKFNRTELTTEEITLIHLVLSGRE